MGPSPHFGAASSGLELTGREADAIRPSRDLRCRVDDYRLLRKGSTRLRFSPLQNPTSNEVHASANSDGHLMPARPSTAADNNAFMAPITAGPL